MSIVLLVFHYFVGVVMYIHELNTSLSSSESEQSSDW